MLFLNARSRNGMVSGMSLHSGPYIHKISYPFIIGGCLLIVTGLILVITGVTSDIKSTTYSGIGIISFGIGLFLTLICFYSKIDICYNNWAYRSRILPVKTETPPTAPIGVLTCSPFAPTATKADNPHTPLPIHMTSPTTAVCNVDIHKVVFDPAIKSESTTTKVS